MFSLHNFYSSSGQTFVAVNTHTAVWRLSRRTWSIIIVLLNYSKLKINNLIIQLQRETSAEPDAINILKTANPLFLYADFTTCNYHDAELLKQLW